MKGTIAVCLQEIIEKNYGKEKFEEILKACGVDTNIVIIATLDIDDALILKIIAKTAEILNITQEELFDIFGDYWVNEYAKRVYKAYFEYSSNAKEFLYNMDMVHKLTTEITKNANPPRFEYEQGSNYLIMKYNSKRGLPVLLPGLIKGVAKYFNEKIKIENINANTFKIEFL